MADANSTNNLGLVPVPYLFDDVYNHNPTIHIFSDFNPSRKLFRSINT